MKLLKNIGIAVVLLGIVSTLAIMFSTTSWQDGVDLTLLFLYLWVLLPYVVLLILAVVIHRKNSSDVSRIAIFIASVTVVMLSVLSYYHSTFVSVSSTSALVFVVIPFYALAAIAIIYLLSWAIIRLMRGRGSS